MATVDHAPEVTTVPARHPFEAVTTNLMRLGTLSLQDFLRSPALEPPAHDTFLYSASNVAQLGYTDRSLSAEPQAQDKRPAHQLTPLFTLHQVCSQTFGSMDPLKYEIIEEMGKDKKQCILTIARPNGPTRSYATKPEFSRKQEARAAAASIAVEMGALDFIKHGAPEQHLRKGLVLAPLDAPSTLPALAPVIAEENSRVREIEQCCVEWRASRVRPHWVQLSDPRPGGKTGCALRIQLSLHSVRVYSVDTVYSDFAEAKNACAQDAVDDGVLEFIRHGNGQTQPAERNYLNAGDDGEIATPTTLSGISLQGFFESLPRPLPESMDGKSATEINAPSWLNMLVQSARGGRLTIHFIWIVDAKYGLHGAVLRVVRPGECRSFLVDPQFPKRADAKAAVCLMAMSQGIGDYIREVGASLDKKIPADDRRRAHECILPFISTEYLKVWPGKHPEMFEYPKEQDAFGCVMTLKLSEDPSPNEIRTWTVPAEYRTKTDAKIASVLLAFANGAVEFLQFRGEPVPPGYVVILPQAPKRPEVSDSGKKSKKRKTPDNANDAVPRSDVAKRQKVEEKVKIKPPTSLTPLPSSLPPRPAPALIPAPMKAAKPGPTAGFRNNFSHPVSREVDRALVPPRGGGGTHQLRSGHTSDRGVSVAFDLGGPNSGYTPQPWDPRAEQRPVSYYDNYPPRGHADPYPPHAVPPTYAEHHPHYGAYPVERGGEYARLHYEPSEPYATRAQPHYSDSDWHGHAGGYPHSDPQYPSQGPSDYYRQDGYRAPEQRVDPRFVAGYSNPARVWEPGPQAASRAGQTRADWREHDASSAARESQGHRGRNRKPIPVRATSVISSGSASGKPATLSSSGGAAKAMLVPRVGFEEGGKGGKERVEKSRSVSVVKEEPPRAAAPTVSATKELLKQAAPAVDAVKKNREALAAASEKEPKSYKAALVEYCAKASLPTPQFFNSASEGTSDDDKGYKLWIILGNERLELPTTFKLVNDGEERLAKKVLMRLRSKTSESAKEQ
ncbi:hypothetical protein BV25DRAFT_1822296 [Artomyces pyxidatus]|uniref:Uncharacterized protein n=1 Tax=Artomyces pyxidatus TaxID=48021 RepID=A0ACB8T9H9_9AGAM|nr:hypothetical protein BV25DRAFT_1822296 [Artomyces pyxidatus]